MKAITKTFLSTVAATVALCSWTAAQEVSPAADTNQTSEESGMLDLEALKTEFESAQGAGETGSFGSHATIKVQEGQFFLGGNDSAKMMEMNGNLPDNYHGSIIAEDGSYTLTFQFSNTGYIKDEEKDELDADDLMESFKENQKEANKARRESGLETYTIVGWAFEPKYNETTNNLEWAILLQTIDGTQFVNHQIKLLGRKGVMDAVLICDSDQLESLRPMLDKTLAGFEYSAGNKYAEFQEGDKIAEYGLKGLIIGGGLLAAGKLGFFALLAKFAKQIVIGIVAVGAFFVKMKDKIFGSKQ